MQDLPESSIIDSLNPEELREYIAEKSKRAKELEEEKARRDAVPPVAVLAERFALKFLEQHGRRPNRRERRQWLARFEQNMRDLERKKKNESLLQRD